MRGSFELSEIANVNDEPVITAEELKKLSRRGMAAFAARCARRVQPLFDIQERVEAVRKAIEVAEDFAKGGAGNPNEAYAAAVATGGSKAHPESGDVASLGSSSSIGASGSSEAAEAAREAAGYAARTGSYYDPGAPTYAAAAAVAAAKAAAAVGDGDGSTATAVKIDYEKLLRLHHVAFPEIDDPIDPSESGPLGPLWPDGKPEWLSKTAVVHDVHASSGIGLAASAATASGVLEVRHTAPIEVYLDPGDAPQELITEFFLALSALYQAHGGSGLKFVNDERRSLVGEEVTL